MQRSRKIKVSSVRPYLMPSCLLVLLWLCRLVERFLVDELYPQLQSIQSIHYKWEIYCLQELQGLARMKYTVHITVACTHAHTHTHTHTLTHKP